MRAPGVETKEGLADLVRIHRPFEIKSISDDGTFEGYGSVFGVKDLGDDIVMPGAFQKTLADHESRHTKPKMLWSHSHQTMPPGIWTEMREDDKGLFLRGKLIDTSTGRDLRVAMKEKAVDGLSIGFDLRKGEVEFDGPVRKIKSLTLWEISPVIFPMNPDARVSAVKQAFSQSDLVQAFEACDRINKLLTTR